ncbi:hypothetical protein PsorP6_016345 [Peronosclerospora sorghi]|uniref:Uncharacterized protein n=1 Tax=Peronosclerospora sorghi TaxID=230839 RepID=A0ACC0VNB0_9STRA|nr:hypothetical protein PsorP6_016345 [Peronosclerospora sorghi]
MRCETFLVAGIALHGCVNDATVSSTTPNPVHTMVDAKHATHLPRSLRAHDPRDKDERMLPRTWLQSKATTSATDSLVTKIRAGSAPALDTSQNVDHVLSAMGLKGMREALKTQSLVEHFVETWGDRVVALALVQAKQSEEKGMLETTGMLCHQLLQSWATDTYAQVFARLDLANEGFTDPSILVLDEYIQFRNNGEPQDHMLWKTLSDGFGNDAKLAFFVGRANEARQDAREGASEANERCVWTMVQGEDHVVFTRLRLSDGLVSEFEGPNSNELKESLRIYAVPAQRFMLALDALLKLLGSEGNFAMLVLHAMNREDELKDVAALYELLLFRHLKSTSVEPKIFLKMFQNMRLSEDEKERVQALALKYWYFYAALV